MTKQQSGFTLIELVLVIVILGILAAAALPRFSNLTQDANNATLKAMQASLRTGATVAHAMQLARNLASNATITYEGATTVTMSNGYPLSTAGGIDSTVDPSATSGTNPDFNFVTGSPSSFQKNGSPNPATCMVQYTTSVGGAFPNIVITSSGC